MNRSRAFVLTGCLLALVFPVVSASDDLNALRTEMEEGKSSDPSIKKSTSHHLPILGSDNPRFATAGRVGLVPPEWDSREQISEYSCGPSQQALATNTGSRAPPYLESFALGARPMAAQFFQLGLNAAIPASEVLMMGLPYNRPQTSVERHGLWSFTCEIFLLTPRGLRRAPRDMARILFQRTCVLMRRFLLLQET